MNTEEQNVLMSIQPRHSKNICDRHKTNEVRRTKPNREPPFKVLMYCTKNSSQNLIRCNIKECYFDDWGHFETFLLNKREMKLQFPGIEPYNGKVFGEFICDKITEVVSINQLDESMLKSTCLTAEEIESYGKGKPLYFWHISKLVIYDKPKNLSCFYKCGFPEIQTLEDKICNYCSGTDFGRIRQVHTPNGLYFCEGRWCDEAYMDYLDENFAIIRPPQSWCYVGTL